MTRLGAFAIIVTMPNEYLWDVFLSYDSRDRARVQRLAEQLREAGLQVWFDTWVIEPGDDIYAAIEHGQEYARTLVLCMSPAALTSQWVQSERNSALFRDPQNSARRFIPLLLEDCQIPDTIRRFSFVDWRDESDDALDRLIQSCQPPPHTATAEWQIDPHNIAPPGGAIHHNDPFYIDRAADAEVVATARRAAGTLIIKAPRQMGKSSLLKRYLAECQEFKKTTVLLDFSMFTPEDLADYPTFLTQLAEALWSSLGQPIQAAPPRINSQRAMIDFIGNRLLAAVPGQVVIAFDEVDKLLGYDYQYCGHILGCLLINDAVIAKGFVLWTGFVQTLPIG